MSELEKKDHESVRENNKATRIITTELGITLAIAGFHHGFSEALQGNEPPSGTVIRAIEESHRMWQYGTEEAFTVILNFLVTGIAAMSISIVVILWSISLRTRNVVLQ